MKKGKVIKDVGVFIVAIMIISSFMSLSVFAETENIKYLELAEETFDLQRMSDTFKEDGSVATYISPSYVSDGEDGYKMQLKIISTNSDMYNQPYFYKTKNQYKDGLFSVKYTPVNTGGTSNGGRIYFRAPKRDQYKYMIQLNPSNISLRADSDNWNVNTVLGKAEYTFTDGTEYDIKVSFKTVDSKNYFKIWVNDEIKIDYTGDLTGIESTNGYKSGKNTPIALGVHGVADNAETTDVDESTRVIFDDFKILDNLTEHVFNGKTDFSATNQGPYWYYMKEIRDARTQNAKNVELLSELSSNGTSWYGDSENDVMVGAASMRPSKSTDGQYAVKMFKAPYNGVITIGAEGDLFTNNSTSQVQIRNNSEVVWPLETDTSWFEGKTYNTFAYVPKDGKEFTPITVNVSKNDKIYFVVKGDHWKGNAWGMQTTWIPTIQYTSVESLGMNAVITDGTTEYAGLLALKESVEGEEKAVKLNVNVYCDAAMDEHAAYRVIAGLYDSEGVLCDAGLSEEKSAMIDGEIHSHEITVGNTANIENGSCIKLFMLNEEACSPYLNSITIK